MDVLIEIGPRLMSVSLFFFFSRTEKKKGIGDLVVPKKLKILFYNSRESFVTSSCETLELCSTFKRDWEFKGIDILPGVL